MLLLIATVLATIGCIVLLLAPNVGIAVIFLVRPIIDTAWQEQIFLGFKLTEIFSVAVPFIVLVLVMMNVGTRRSVTQMPFWKFWAVYLLYILTFCVNIALTSSIVDAADVFFRFANGFVGFYLIQAYFFEGNKKKWFFLMLAFAGIFPIATGLYESITGVHWRVTTSEGEIRSIGLYHDAITIRYYGMQTILAISACFALNYPKNKVIKSGLIGLFAGALVVVFKALSKSGLFSLFVWGVIWSYGRRSWFIPSIVLVGSMILIPFYFQEIGDAIYNVFHKEIGALTGEIEATRSFSGRWIGWEGLINEWSKMDIIRQWFGSGEKNLGTHNDYLQMLLHGGIIGLIFYISFLIVVGWQLTLFYLKHKSALSIVALMAYTMWLVDTIGLVPSIYSGYQWFVWGVIGLCLRTKLELERNYKYYERKKAKLSP